MSGDDIKDSQMVLRFSPTSSDPAAAIMAPLTREEAWMEVHRWRKVGRMESICKAVWEIFFFSLGDSSAAFLPSSRELKTIRFCILSYISGFLQRLASFFRSQQKNTAAEEQSTDAACVTGNKAVACATQCLALVGIVNNQVPPYSPGLFLPLN